MGVRPRRLGHIGMVVRDMDRMIAFYCEALDMDLSDRMPYPEDSPFIESAWLRCDNDHHVLSFFTLRQPPAEPERPANAAPVWGFGLHHVAFELTHFEELRRALAYVREHDLPLQGPPRQGGPGSQIRLYFRDPEQNIVELYWGLDQIGWDGSVRPYPEIEAVDLDTITEQEFLAWKGTAGVEAGRS